MVKKEQPVRGDILKNALDTFDFLGASLKQALIEYIESGNRVLDDKHSYYLKEIEFSLRKIFGDEATALIIARIRRAAKELGAKPK